MEILDLTLYCPFNSAKPRKRFFKIKLKRKVREKDATGYIRTCKNVGITIKIVIACLKA